MGVSRVIVRDPAKLERVKAYFNKLRQIVGAEPIKTDSALIDAVMDHFDRLAKEGAIMDELHNVWIERSKTRGARRPGGFVVRRDGTRQAIPPNPESEQ